MMTLAFEFSSPRRSVAVVRGSGTGAEVLAEVAEELGGMKPLPMAERALREAGVEREAVERIAVGLGPGSYTGIRSAIAIAQGWELGRGTPVAGAGSMECLAAQAWEMGWRGHVSFVVDAQRGEVYWLRCEMVEEGWREVEPLRLAKPEEVEGDIVAGPEAGRWFGEGRVIFPEAGMVGRLAKVEERAEPIYLRETQFVKAGRR